jgi:ferredoxin-NADP reductase
LVFGVATEADLFCVDELPDLSRDLPNLDVVITVERPTADWSGAVGRVTDHLDPIDPTRSYYLCGPPGMVSAAEELLVGHGVPRDRVHTERFLETGDEQP